MDKETFKLVGGYLLIAIIAYFLLKKIGSGISESAHSVITGDAFKSDAEKSTEKAIQVKSEATASTWIGKEKKLPAKQRTQITRATANSIANTFHQKFKVNFLGQATRTSTGDVMDIFKKLATTGSLFYVMSEFGVRDGLDFNQYINKAMPSSSILLYSIEDVNKMLKSKGISYAF